MPRSVNRMIGKSVYRSIRQRFKSAVIWVMVPMAAISGRSVSGCLSPSGHFDPNCQCLTGGAAVCHCHCSKCGGGANCCCKSKALAGQPASGSGVQNERCRTVGIYAVTTAINASKVLTSSADSHQSADSAVLTTDQPCSLAKTSGQHVAELNTGPPPDNLVVTLRHWII